MSTSGVKENVTGLVVVCLSIISALLIVNVLEVREMRIPLYSRSAFAQTVLRKLLLIAPEDFPAVATPEVPVTVEFMLANEPPLAVNTDSIKTLIFAVVKYATFLLYYQSHH